jgi:hypothetical protein
MKKVFFSLQDLITVCRIKDIVLNEWQMCCFMTTLSKLTIYQVDQKGATAVFKPKLLDWITNKQSN